MKTYSITCICGTAHQINEGDNVICTCGAILAIADCGRDRVTPVATIAEDSIAKRIASGHPVKLPHPILKALWRR